MDQTETMTKQNKSTQGTTSSDERSPHTDTQGNTQVKITEQTTKQTMTTKGKISSKKQRKKNQGKERKIKSKLELEKGEFAKSATIYVNSM